MTHLLDHGGGDGGDLASMCVRWGGDLIPSGDEADSVERRRRRDEEQWIHEGSRPIAREVQWIGYGGADVDANGSIELKKYPGSVNGKLGTCRHAELSGRVKPGEGLEFPWLLRL